MRLYEYEAKELFKRYRIPVLDRVVIDRASLFRLDHVTYPVVIKAQVFLGGRGKAGFVQHAADRPEAEKKITEMLGRQHGGYSVEKVLVEKRVEFETELYVAATIDRLEHKPLIMVSKKGGVEVEETARHGPQDILKYYFKCGEIMDAFQARKIAHSLSLTGPLLVIGAEVILNLYTIFSHLDCKLVEINPLVKTGDTLYALDAKVDLDEDALFRHPELKDHGIEVRHEVGELTQRERFAKAKGFPYVDLDGDIGVFPGGAGFGIAALDLIQHYGGQPANFMDSGGAPTQDKLRAMLGLLIDNPRVKVIFGARFGGISRCDDWAKAVVQYVFENKPKKPMIMRMAGNMEQAGRKIIEQAKREHPDLFRHIRIYAYDTPIEEVIKETVRVAQKSKEC